MIKNIEDYPFPKKDEVYNLFYNDNNINNCVIHIRGIVDDKIVYAIFYNKTNTYVYHIESIEFFFFRQDKLTLVLEDK